MPSQIEIRLRRSPIRTTPNQRENLQGLGLRRREQTVVLQDTSSIRGMIRKVIHLVEVRRPQTIKQTAKPRFLEIDTNVEVKSPSKKVTPKPKKKTSVAKKKKEK